MDFINRLFFIFLFLIWIVQSIRIEENAYHGISLSFSDQIKEQHFNFEKLKQILKISSEYLYHATRKRAYFQEFIFILPSTWTSDSCTGNVTEPPKNVDIFVTNSVEDLTAKHSRGCGHEGDRIYMPVNWLTGETEDLARQFVRQWSIYRYGIFDENPVENGACYISPKKLFSPVGCYNVKVSSEPEFSDNGLSKCSSFDESKLIDLKSSLMFKTNFSKALEFCDGTPTYPHNPVMPTLHNNLCGGKTTWSVIENSNDFKYGKNMPGKSPFPPNNPVFKCYRDQTLQLILAVQTSSITDITLAVDELRYTLHYFLRNLVYKEATVNLVVFSDESDESEPVELNLKNDKELSDILSEKIATETEKSKACLVCGIRKALNVSLIKSYSSSKVVIIAFESAIINQKLPEIVELIESNRKVQTHLMLIKGTENHEVSTSLVKALRQTGGYLHTLPKPFRVINNRIVPNVLLYKQLNVLLLNVIKSSLEVNDKVIVVHEAIYETDSVIMDTFTTPPATAGKLVYIMHCDLKGQIITYDTNCVLPDELSSTFKCGSINNINTETPKTWTYKFTFRSGVERPICASIAILLLSSSSSKETVSARGWLKEYVITPGHNSQIIYVEVLGVSLKDVVQVSAHISGPEKDETLELRDNGNGDPDVKENDGIYSRYFTLFKGKGTYIVTITLKLRSAENINFMVKAATDSNKDIIYKNIIGSFIVTAEPSNVDITPPNRIGNLKLVSVDHENSTITLSWTAPGNDYDFGTAMKYEIKCASHPANLMDLFFDDEETTLLSIQKNPQESGKQEIHEFNFPKSKENSIKYIALRAKDLNGNKGKISNIVQVFMKKSLSEITESYTSMSETSSETTNTLSSINENSTVDMNFTSEEFTLPNILTTTETNNNATTDLSWKDILSNTKFIIIISSAGGFLLLLIIVNVIVCCCCFMKKKKNSPKTISKKNSLKPPYNLNIVYQQESQSINQSESDIGASISTSEDQKMYSSPTPEREGNTNPVHFYHTSRSLLDKSKSSTDSKLGFQLVETLPSYATKNLSRFVKRLDENNSRQPIKPTAQPQQPSDKSNETLVYSLGVV